MTKILVITDSLGLPRPTPEIVKYNETWVNKLSELYRVHQLSIGGGTISNLFSQIEYLKMFEPDFVIIQSGIVDCAPRALTKFESEFFNKFKVTKKILNLYLTKDRTEKLRKKRNKTYTSFEDFEKYLNLFAKEFGDKLYFVGILPGNENYEKKVPGVVGNINKYNALIQVTAIHNFISVDDFCQDDIMTDYIHLTKKGHQKLFERIVKTIPII
ncbi:MAG: SGNH/GDSL hydrolase family protein [Bacteroidetes bacterium]|nr:SGNH/GDSL hydrolase family protein [Bacteroidota bacterium]